MKSRLFGGFGLSLRMATVALLGLIAMPFRRSDAVMFGDTAGPLANPWAPPKLAETLQVVHRGRDQGYSAERRQGRHRWGMAFLRAEAARMTARMRTWQIGLPRWATANPRVAAGAH